MKSCHMLRKDKGTTPTWAVQANITKISLSGTKSYYCYLFLEKFQEKDYIISIIA